MRRNVSGQVIGAQMVSATDGSAFTGSVTCYVTGDGGTQAAGSVGSGACAHEGNGFHTYAPAQAETNYSHAAYTFTGSGAVPVTVQVFPRAYDANGVASADVTHIGADATALANFKKAFDDTAGAVPHQFISDQGTLQAVGSTSSVTLAATASSENGAYVGHVFFVVSATTGALQATNISAYNGSTKVATLSPALGTALTGAVVYKVAATAPVSGGGGPSAADIWSYSTRRLTDATNIVSSGTSIPITGSRVDASVGAMASGVLTDTAIALNAITDAKVAASAVTKIQSGLATSSALTAAAGDLTAVKAKTDALTFTQTGHVDANMRHINNVTITGNGQTGSEFGV